jgi:phosphoribosyl-AMP cyclohydrolase
VWLAIATEHTLSARWQTSPAGFLFLQRLFRQGAIVQIAFDKSGGLVPAIIQDEASGDVLMLGFMNAESFELTRRGGEVVFFSRSRNKLWKKGESSGHVLKVCEIRIDCDADALLIRVKPVGPGVCHQGYRSCFFRSLNSQGQPSAIAEPTFSPESVYSPSDSNPRREGK